MLCPLSWTRHRTTLGQTHMDSGPVLPHSPSPPRSFRGGSLSLLCAGHPCLQPQANAVHWRPGRLPRLPRGQGASRPTGNPLSLLCPGPVRTSELQPVCCGAWPLGPPPRQGLPSPDGQTSRGPAHGCKDVCPGREESPASGSRAPALPGEPRAALLQGGGGTGALRHPSHRMLTGLL